MDIFLEEVVKIKNRIEYKRLEFTIIYNVAGATNDEEEEDDDDDEVGRDGE